MKTIITTCLIFTSCSFLLIAQSYSQYFDGEDTLDYNSIMIELDPDSSNIWQIGKPQKTIFDSAATLPNALITDTANFYPPSNTSRVSFNASTSDYYYGVLALQWKQKIDFDYGQDGGLVEFSVDSGQTWQNALNNPFVYNFYGFDTSNIDSIFSGELGFTGTDSFWRDIWLCFDYSYFGYLTIRFSIKSDSIDNDKEGWMIDNLLGHVTLIHTVNEKEPVDYLKVYPNKTNGIVHIEAEKRQEYHIIENMELVNVEGKVVERFGKSPIKFYIDIGNHSSGLYFLKVNTNVKSQTFPIFLENN